MYRQHSGSTTNVPRAINNELLVLEAALGKWGTIGPDGSVLPDQDLARRLRQLNFDHGYLHYWRGDPCAACRAFWQSMRHGSRSLKTLAYLGMSGMMCQRTRRKHLLEG